MAAVWLAAPAALTAEPIVLRGSVHATDSGGLPQARVELAPMKSNFEWARGVLEEPSGDDVAGWVETGHDGRFAIEVPEVGVWRLRVRAPGFVPMRYFPLPVTHSVDLPPIRLLPAVEVRVAARQPPDRSVAWVYAASENGAMWEQIATDGWRTGPRFGRLDGRGRWAVPRAEGEVLELSMFLRGAPVPSRAHSQDSAVAIPRPEGTRERWIGVRDPAGTPVAGLVVTGELAWPVGRTDEAGKLKLAGAFSKPIGLELFGEGNRRQKVVLEPDGTGTDPTAWYVLAEPVTIAGRVLDAARNEPLAGALVWPGHDPGSFTRTDATGRFEIPFPAGDRYWIQAEMPGHLPRLHRFETATEPPAPLTLTLREAAEIRGQVVDGRGTPIPGASLAARTEDRPPSAAFFHPDRAWSRSTSDGEGRFRLGDLDPDRRYSIEARGDGLRPAQVEAGKPSARREVRLVVERNRPATGRVVDAEERPLAGATVELHAVSSPADPPARDGSWRVETDPEGIFHLADLPARRLDIEARKTGFARLKVRGVEVPPGTGPVDLGTLTLEPGTAIHGKITDLEGEAVADVGVWMVDDTGQPVRLDDDRLLEADPAALSGDDGRFRLADLERGRKVHLLFDREGYLTASRMGVVAPNEKPLDVELTPASRVSGRVVDEDGEPIARAEVSLSAERSDDPVDLEHRRPHDARSDDEGRFVLDKLVPGPATVTVFARGFRPPPPQEIVVPAGALEDLLFVLERGAVLTGTVTDAGGEAVEGARLSVGRPYAISGADGSYRMQGLSPGPQRLDVDHGAYNRAVLALEIEPGTNTADVVLEGGFRVTGSVVDAAGAAVAKADVSLRLRSLTASRSYEARAGNDGRFSVERVAEGSYDVEASRRGYATAEIFEAFEVAGAPVDGLRIVLRGGASVVGHVLGLSFEELAAVQVEARRNGQQGRQGSVAYDGRYEVAELSAGDWQLLARVPGTGRQAEARVTIEPGDEQVVRDLEFRGGLVLQGRVSHRGQPLAGADVSLTGLDIATRRTVTTDSQGGFRFDDLEAGRYRLDAVHRVEFLVHGEELELSSDRTVDIDIWTATARGTVTSAAAAGGPVAGAVVSMQRLGPSEDSGGPLFTAGTESDGRFRVIRLGEGSYRVAVRKPGFLPAEETVDVAPGVDVDDLDFALTPADGLGLVLGLASGRRVSTASVHVFDGAGQLVQTEVQPVAEDGYVRFSVAAGSWDVLVSAPGAVARRIAVTVPSEAQAVVLQEGARLRIRVPALMESNRIGTLTLSGPDGRRVESVDASGALQRAWSVPGGVASIDGLPAGVWTLELVADGQTWRQTATLAAGLESEVTLQ